MRSWKTQVGFLLVLLFAGCAGVPPATRGEQPPGGAPHGGVVVAPRADVRATPSTTASTIKSAINAAPSDAKTVANVPSPAPALRLPKKDSIAPALAKQKPPAPFDVTTLEKRLRETQAIGVLAKIALRNQIDDLLSQFHAFHLGKLKTTLAELRRPYDLLVLKVLALLQENDPSLAAAIVASREAIWRILSDPAKFATI
jgi:hypothetical protein